MELHPSPRIISSDRLKDCLIIMFDDGSCGAYSGVLLYSMLPHAKRVEVIDFED